MSIEAVLADQIAAGRALLMIFYVTQREVKIEAVRGRQAGGVALAVGYAQIRRFCRGVGYRQFMVIASGLSWVAVLVAFVGNPGTGYGGSEFGEGSASLPAGARAR
jgi:hypothetical protein